MAIVTETSQKPTLVFLPGAWHTPECFEKVMAQLKALGYPTTTTQLPSVGGKVSTTMTDDAAHINKFLSQLVDDGKDVVLIMHSYSGIPGTESVKGLAKKDRQAAGLPGGIVALVYIAAFLLPQGQSLVSFLGSMPDWVIFDGDRLTVETGPAVFYNDLPSDTAEYWSSKLQHHAWPSFNTPLSYPAYQHVPSTYLFCEQDMAIPLPGQKAMASFAGEGLKTHTCTASHSPMLSMLELVVNVIRGAAGEAI
ncbi:hypothetical protein VTN77DRAFT_3455 [Rasamsonia byssochlamydoides]|uniref:uncharacterized protein n=1 Tax=Rasamsonia byssochlamydoides TaxID=89139 RepID=UPI0037436B42